GWGCLRSTPRCARRTCTGSRAIWPPPPEASSGCWPIKSPMRFLARSRGSAGAESTMPSPPSRDPVPVTGTGRPDMQELRGRATRRAWAEIDLSAARENVRALRAALRGTPRLMALVKAAAYRHGALPVSRASSDAAAVLRQVSAYAGIVVEGCFAHFATADEADLGPTRKQLETFLAVLRGVVGRGLPIGLRHAANSAAFLALPETHLDIVRAGIAIYGVPPAPHLAGRVPLRRVMRLRARVAHTKRVPSGTPIGYGHTYLAPRETRIATIPIGYADGYPRLAGETREVLLNGRRARIAGRIAMDQ